MDEDYIPSKRKCMDSEDGTKKTKVEVPEWFKEYMAEHFGSSDSEGNDSDSESGSDHDYFEEDCTKLKQTIIKHILERLTLQQGAALRRKINLGVNEAFTLLNKLVSENYYPLLNVRPTNNLWKLGMGPREIKKYDRALTKLREDQQRNQVTVQRILDTPMTQERKCQTLALYDTLQTQEPFSFEYMETEMEINQMLHDYKLTDNLQLTEVEQRLTSLLQMDRSLKERILTADIDDQRKAAIYEKYLLLQKTSCDSTTAASLEEWIEEALKTPYQRISEPLEGTIGEYLNRLANKFRVDLSYLDLVLEPLLTIFNNRLSCPSSKSMVIGLLGSPGTGKTKIGQVIAEAWGIPFQQISLGGMVDSSILDGQHPGWVGSNPGRVVKALQQMGSGQGVLFLDEIDKLGETQHGLQVQASLLHSLDPVQNNKYNDHYLGPKLPLDLSNCLIICAMNKTSGLDPALLNRMHLIKIPDYTESQKIDIIQKHLLPTALKNVGLPIDSITIPKEVCSIVCAAVKKNNGAEGGVRGVKTCIQMIVDKLHLLMRLTPEDQQNLKLSFKTFLIDPSKSLTLTPELVHELYKPNESTSNHWVNMFH
jgi:ATP-dependent Lon protease